MSERTKRILIIVGIVIAVAVVVWLLWSLFRSAPPPELGEVPTPPVVGQPPPVLPSGGVRTLPPVSVTPATTTPPGVSATTPTAVARGGATTVTALTDDEAFQPLPGRDGTIRYYAPSTGKFFEALPDKTKRELAPTFFPNVRDIVWYRTGDRAILSFPDGAKVLYDFREQRQISLPSHWHDFSFSPDGAQIVFKTDHPNPDKRWLIAASPDGSQVKAIEPIGDNGNNVTPLWSPTNEVAALFRKSVSFSRQEVYFLGFNQENFKTMLVEGVGFKAQWSPRGDRLLYSIYPNDQILKPQLWIADARGEEIGKNRKYLRVETWVDKCVFADDAISVYCAIPRNLPIGSGAYPELASGVADDFYKIDTATGIRTLVAIPAQDVRAENISLTTTGGALIFKDAFTGKVMEIRLK